MTDPFQLSALRFLEHGDQLRAQSRWAEAKAAYLAAQDSDPDNPGAWLGLGLCAEGIGDLAAAQTAFAEAARLHPERVDAWLGLASANHALGQGTQAIRAWLQAWLLSPADLRLHNIVWQALNETETAGEGYAGAVCRGNRLRAQGQNDEALVFYRQAQKQEPGLPFAYSRAGCLLAKNGDYAGAEMEFSQARALSDWVESGIRLNPSFFNELPIFSPALSWVKKAEGNGPLAVVGCDAVYFKRYAQGLWESLCRCEGETASLHVHLLYPAAESLAMAQAMGVGLSVESPDFQGSTRNFVNTYYASARFLVLPDLLKAYDRPLLVMDVDAAVLKPLAPLWTVLAGNDMAIRRLQGAMVDPWNEPQANLVGVNPTPKGLAFAQSLSRFLAHFVARRLLFGFFDQTALYSVLAADPALADLQVGQFPANAYGYPLNRGALGDLVYPDDLLVGEVKTPLR